ncbi:hypothetical protein ACTI_20930 [Actinoplanes sp. OR16]|uniref:hypothetical protein n=1 Tax=Actinoplanes sp. OR16 TaxID=946334 RepID=UPI000F7200B8|nr:hypothetical protein [Actinoplanes sp. OR16]BBH65408.1 hypothetical protein ACTI_20930 [Actinoplanes sp. OR16]
MDQREWDYGARMSRERRAAEAWPTRETDDDSDPRWASLTDTGSMAPSDEALSWQRRADAWAQQAEVEVYGGGGQNVEPTANRWSDVASTGRTAFPADGQGWRTETSEWRATGARWRQTTEWRSSTGSHVWRSTTEAWQSEEELAAANENQAIPGTAWPTPDQEETGNSPASWQRRATTPVEQTPSWQRPSTSTPSWQRGTGSWSTRVPEQPPGENTTGLARWERTDAPGWQTSPVEDAQHLVRDDDRAAWQRDQSPRRGRRRAPDPDPAPSGGSGWSTESNSDSWESHTDTGNIQPWGTPTRSGGVRPDEPEPRRSRRRAAPNDDASYGEPPRAVPPRSSYGESPRPPFEGSPADTGARAIGPADTGVGAAPAGQGGRPRRYNQGNADWREDTASWTAEPDTSNWTRDPDTGQWSRAEDDPRVLAWRAEAARRESMKDTAEPDDTPAPRSGRRARRDEPAGGVPGGPLPSSGMPSPDTAWPTSAAPDAPGSRGMAMLPIPRSGMPANRQLPSGAAPYEAGGPAPYETGAGRPRPGDTGQFGRRPGDTGPFGPRPGDTGQFGSRPGDTGQFGSRPGDTGQFGSRSGDTGQFGGGPGDTGQFSGGGRRSRDEGQTGDYGTGRRRRAAEPEPDADSWQTRRDPAGPLPPRRELPAGGSQAGGSQVGGSQSGGFAAGPSARPRTERPEPDLPEPRRPFGNPQQRALPGGSDWSADQTRQDGRWEASGETSPPGRAWPGTTRPDQPRPDSRRDAQSFGAASPTSAPSWNRDPSGTGNLDSTGSWNRDASGSTWNRDSASSTGTPSWQDPSRPGPTRPASGPAWQDRDPARPDTARGRPDTSRNTPPARDDRGPSWSDPSRTPSWRDDPRPPSWQEPRDDAAQQGPSWQNPQSSAPSWQTPRDDTRANPGAPSWSDSRSPSTPSWNDPRGTTDAPSWNDPRGNTDAPSWNDPRGTTDGPSWNDPRGTTNAPSWNDPRGTTDTPPWQERTGPARPASGPAWQDGLRGDSARPGGSARPVSGTARSSGSARPVSGTARPVSGPAWRDDTGRTAAWSADPGPTWQDPARGRNPAAAPSWQDPNRDTPDWQVSTRGPGGDSWQSPSRRGPGGDSWQDDRGGPNRQDPPRDDRGTGSWQDAGRDTRSGSGRAGQDYAGQGYAGQDRAGQDRAGQDRAGQDRAGRGWADQGREGNGHSPYGTARALPAGPSREEPVRPAYDAGAQRALPAGNSWPERQEPAGNSWSDRQEPAGNAWPEQQDDERRKPPYGDDWPGTGGGGSYRGSASGSPEQARQERKPTYGTPRELPAGSGGWPDPLSGPPRRASVEPWNASDAPEPGATTDWLAAERATSRRNADYRDGAGQGGETDWRQSLAPQSDLAEGESRRYDTSDFPPFRPSGSATVDGSANLALSTTSVIKTGPDIESPAAPPVSAARTAKAATPPAPAAWATDDKEDTSWPPRRSTGAFQGTGSYERRPVTSGLVASSGTDLLDPDDDEEDEETSNSPLAAVGYTVVWYGVPVILFVAGMFLLNSGQRSHALDTLADAAPEFAVSLALSMLVAFALRRATTAWKSASVGLAAAVVGGGLATVLSSAITGNSLS